MILVLVLASSLCVLLGAWTASTSIEQRRARRRSLRTVDDYATLAGGWEQEMSEPITRRILQPAAAALLRVARRATPAGYVERVTHDLVAAGEPPGFELDRFLVWKAVAAGAAPVWGVIAFAALGLDGLAAVVLAGAASVATFVLPDVALRRRVAERRRAIERALPDVLDLLVISVEAGLGFEQAFERTAAAVPGPFSEEARRYLQEVRMGASRADGLRALGARVQVDDVQTFVLALLQADSFGISIARVLRSQADEMRVRHHQRAQERAQKAPVKMLFPLAVCIFPALFIPVLMPAVLRIFETL